MWKISKRHWNLLHTKKARLKPYKRLVLFPNGFQHYINDMNPNLITLLHNRLQNAFQERALELDMVQKLKDETRILSAQLGNVQFTYRDPMKNFDRSRVKGVVAKLIKVKDSSTMTSLEVGST